MVLNMIERIAYNSETKEVQFEFPGSSVRHSLTRKEVDYLRSFFPKEHEFRFRLTRDTGETKIVSVSAETREEAFCNLWKIQDCIYKTVELIK